MATAWKVTNRSGWAIDSDSITMRFLTNADNPGDIGRDRYIITPAATGPTTNPWDRCSGSSTTD